MYDGESYKHDKSSHRHSGRDQASLSRGKNLSKEALPNSELAIMELLWERDRLTARQLRESLYPGSTRAQAGTVQKLLQRLEDKRFVDRDRGLSVHFYSPLISKKDYACGQLESLTEKLMGGSLAPFITHMVEESRISRDEIERLRDVLSEKSVPEGNE
jgi:BlaI family transcriptional regulator, penicillinase repressor